MSGYLLDTHVLLWAALGSDRLPAFSRTVLESQQAVSFSVVSLWEIVIKSTSHRTDVQVDAEAVRTFARLGGLGELAVTGEHVLALRELDEIHRDPIDRLLVAQARQEELELLTVDPKVLGYGRGVRPA